MPTFAFVATPAYLAVHLQRHYNAPLPNLRFHSFGDTLDARLFSAQERSTSELLRTL